MSNDFIKDIKTVGPADFYRMLGETPFKKIVDVRPAEAFAKGHLAGAKNLPFADRDIFISGIKHISKRLTLFVYCRSGRTSSEAAEYLANNGYRVVNLAGGFEAWQSSGYPVVD